jgi:hypothetical protein
MKFAFDVQIALLNDVCCYLKRLFSSAYVLVVLVDNELWYS